MRAAILLLGTSGVAAACPSSAYVARVGTLSPGARCGEWVAVAHETRAAVAVGRFGAQFDLELRWQQLDGGDATLQLQIPGGYLLIRDDHIGLYTSEAEWADHGYNALPHHRTSSPMTVRVRGHGDRIEAWVDGTPAAAWTVRTRQVVDVEVGIVGQHARLWFTDVVSRPTSGAPAPSTRR